MESETNTEPGKVYEKPELVRHGDIDELTQGSAFRDAQGDCASTNC